MKREILVNGRETPAPSADVFRMEPGLYSILLNGASYRARVLSTPEGLQVVVENQTFIVEVRDPRSLSRKAAADKSGARQNISATMPGKIVRVLVTEGQTVERGQGLIVVEAMKMQNEMKAAKPGTVAKINAREGATVAAGELLMVLE